ncbi:hypothetical protein M413DRAFT_444394 [Hebeloma cylindrosporum]|uniref:DUF6697 domain-containing protein n=1 Tax=Hebeloma cylindrosporum TaxID=76867 RepID=A0A0C2XYM7_HEBCY|nr:hypothetical protein M413DRAFT_444394 [Hebeloma cylindrosporum h7]
MRAIKVEKDIFEKPFLTSEQPSLNDASLKDSDAKADVIKDRELALESKLRFSSESTLASSCVNHEWDMKHDNVKIEVSKGWIAQHAEISSIAVEENVKIEDVAYSSSLAAPVQKRRRLQIEVVVPTLDLLQRRIKNQQTLKLKKMQNPKIKKKSNRGFSLDTVWARTDGIPAFEVPLDKETQELTVSRDFMSSTYGGSMQATCPKISKRKLAQHGKDNFTYLHPDYHQHAPEVAGSSGLFFNHSPGPDWEGLQRVFTRIESNKWQFMGMYEFKSCASLSKEEWKRQNERVRNTWTREICRQGWARHLRARVRGRIDLSREPTEAEVEEIVDSERYRTTTPEEVMKAYNCGEERIGVWALKCVDYDLPFQLELCKKFPLWVPRPRKPRGSKKSAKKPARAKRTTNSQSRGGRKRKRSESLLSELTELDDEPSDNEPRMKKDLEMDIMDIYASDSDDEPIYTSKGTRSRPICL